MYHSKIAIRVTTASTSVVHLFLLKCALNLVTLRINFYHQLTGTKKALAIQTKGSHLLIFLKVLNLSATKKDHPIYN